MYRNRLAQIVLTNAAVLIALAWLGNSLAATTEESDSTDRNAYLLTEPPEDAADVVAVRNDAKDQQDVVVVGRIGGRTNPWIKGAAAFSIVDRSLTPCNEIEGDTCKTPWDYCCEDDLPKATVLVMVVDNEGKVVKQDARKLLGVKELDTVFIQGKAKRDKANNITILTAKLFIPAEEKETTQ
jgi:hypothetical protein